LITTPECWVPALGSPEHGFPLLSGAGRLVVKDAIMMGAALVTMADSAKAYLRRRGAAPEARVPERELAVPTSWVFAADRTSPVFKEPMMSTNLLAPNPPAVLAPPFTLETATQKVRLAEDAWNSRDPDRVALAYTEDSVWRNRGEFVTGRDQIRAFLAGKWE